jgi:hypothetical protein
MTIIRNSAKCTACGAEIESTHRHDFVVHYCEVEPAQRRKWDGNELVHVPGEITWRFAVDGGKDYIRRCGSGYQETSEFKDEPT